MSKKSTAVVRRSPSTPRGEESVAKILDACRELLASDGFAKLTTNHVAQQAGLSIGTLYQYFPNKESMLYALVERWYQALNKEFESAVASTEENGKESDDIYELMRRIYIQILERQYQHYRAYADIDKIAASIPELADLQRSHNQQFAERLLALFERFGYSSNKQNLKQLSVFFHQLAVTMLNQTALQKGKAREINLELSLRLSDEMVKAAIEMSQE
ncbi:TetR/AcrR family transcriptional regulator [uncultured Pseudoteredinibacter sp.]|uniref:TetR/AcrR family transcriptional regulator n=1 Tax=uncultured Pseudoteredinibacter sp. TaxID=1641701 RepID=UPI00261C8A99|nr:TetR/AcrR family transcriptional regulator [uncultured Pseudoteredinibacter sp.]